jgi:hypothetical protein
MEQAINLLDHLSQKIATLTTKKIPKISYSKNDNEWRTFVSQSKPHWEDIAWRVKVPNESGESEVHLGFYSAKTSDLLNSAIIDVTNEFQSKTDNIIKNENGIRLVWNVNVNDPESIDKVVTAITDIITNFFMHAQKVLFGGKEKTPFEPAIVTTETVKNPSLTENETNEIKILEHFIGYNGIGKFIFDDGSVYEGEWLNGNYHGHGKLIFEEGEYYEGMFEKNLPHGAGIRKWSNGNFYDGFWKGALRNGQGKMTYASGNVYEGEWSEGLPHKGKMTYADGDVYEGEWKESLPHGQGKMTYASGNVYEGEWKES